MATMSMNTIPLTRRYKGIENDGNTCYMNSVLQQIYMNPNLRRIIQKYGQEYTKHSNSILKGFLDIIRNLDTRVLRGSNNFHVMVGFARGQQDDSHNFMCKLFQSICKTNAGKQLEQAINDEIAIEVVNYTTMTACSHKHVKTGTHYALTIPCAGSFTSGIRDFCKREENFKKGKCSECRGGKQNLHREKKLNKLPRTIYFHVNRIVLSDSCTIDEVIDLKEFCEVPPQPSTNKQGIYLLEQRETTHTELHRIENEQNKQLSKFRWFEIDIALDNGLAIGRHLFFLITNLPKHVEDDFRPLSIPRNKSPVMLQKWRSSGKQNPDSRGFMIPSQLFENGSTVKLEFRILTRSKVEKLVEFNIFDKSGTPLVRDARATKIVQTSSETRYRIVGFVIHVGTKDSGHNYSYIEARDPEFSQFQEWLLFNDHSVNPSSKENAMRSGEKDAVMAIYEKFSEPKLPPDLPPTQAPKRTRSEEKQPLSDNEDRQKPERMTHSDQEQPQLIFVQMNNIRSELKQMAHYYEEHQLMSAKFGLLQERFLTLSHKVESLQRHEADVSQINLLPQMVGELIAVKESMHKFQDFAETAKANFASLNAQKSQHISQEYKEVRELKDHSRELERRDDALDERVIVLERRPEINSGLHERLTKTNQALEECKSDMKQVVRDIHEIRNELRQRKGSSGSSPKALEETKTIAIQNKDSIHDMKQVVIEIRDEVRQVKESNGSTFKRLVRSNCCAVCAVLIATASLVFGLLHWKRSPGWPPTS